jgi:predicted component of type VI protein secretion system
LGNRVRSAKGLQQLLRGYFGFPRVRILQFAPAWVEIPVPTRLGSPATALGATTRLGERMEDLLSRFVVEIGPLPPAWFNRFLPSSRALVAQYSAAPDRNAAKPASELLERVKDLIETYLRDPLDFQVKVLLENRGDAPPPTLGSEHARMGMGIWLGAKPAGEVACRL